MVKSYPGGGGLPVVRIYEDFHPTNKSTILGRMLSNGRMAFIAASDTSSKIPPNDFVAFCDSDFNICKTIPLKPFYDKIFRIPDTFYSEDEDTLIAYRISDYYPILMDTNHVYVSITYEDTAYDISWCDYCSNEFDRNYILNLVTGVIIKTGEGDFPDIPSDAADIDYKFSGNYFYLSVPGKVLIYDAISMQKVHEILLEGKYGRVSTTKDGKYFAITMDDSIVTIFDSGGTVIRTYTQDDIRQIISYSPGNSKHKIDCRAYPYNDCFILDGPPASTREGGHPPFKAIVCPPDFSIKNHIEMPNMTVDIILIDSTYGIVATATHPASTDTIYIYYIEPTGHISYSTYKVIPGMDHKYRYAEGGTLVYPDYFFIYPTLVSDTSYIYRIVR